ncbi:conserved hypothetical protein [Talaromyces stipitatus ATCC 10500]|uniref:Uncharacterized protein n=1 Tax=Talaromyces stipitatus (strain ATCC 10500 / CBS 375.48 / QM 6759 / NRRL 1006) TaxID=441959 RepID=B8MNM3_TALSN|nr:uncharacterized protein TSTA_103360 [Talaromyces stipitatus ATCC 10500]EED14112.1 conserved hypothetical protein [Talaromyces stipitatus ATCC 10500]
MSPTIYGLVSGLFNKLFIQIPRLMRTAIEVGAAEYVNAHWNHVHIADLASLYEPLLRSALDGKDGLAFGVQGIYFSETGEHTWLDLSLTDYIAAVGETVGEWLVAVWGVGVVFIMSSRFASSGFHGSMSLTGGGLRLGLGQSGSRQGEEEI